MFAGNAKKNHVPVMTNASIIINSALHVRAMDIHLNPYVRRKTQLVIPVRKINLKKTYRTTAYTLSEDDSEKEQTCSTSESESTYTSCSAQEHEKEIKCVKKKHPAILKLKINEVGKHGVQICGGCHRNVKPRKVNRTPYRLKGDFHTSIIINNNTVEALVDTGADVNVISYQTASLLGVEWNKSKIKLTPYGSKPLKVCGKFHGPINFLHHSNY